MKSSIQIFFLFLLSFFLCLPITARAQKNHPYLLILPSDAKKEVKAPKTVSRKVLSKSRRRSAHHRRLSSHRPTKRQEALDAPDAVSAAFATPVIAADDVKIAPVAPLVVDAVQPASIRETKNSAVVLKEIPPVQDFRRHISAKSAVVMDSETGQILYAHNPDLPGQPASTIKVLTAFLAIRHLKDSDRVSVSQRAAAMPRSKIYLKSGVSYPAGDLIDATLLNSANDASVALAERIAGSEEDFAAMMTKTAYSLGAKGTVCKTANGLTARGQHTTARELALIFSNAMKEREFKERISRRDSITSFGSRLKNHNKALWQVDGAEGGKTGFTEEARCTYVGQFSRDGATLVVAFLGSERMWTDVRKLVEYGFDRKFNLRAEAAAGRLALRREKGSFMRMTTDARDLDRRGDGEGDAQESSERPRR